MAERPEACPACDGSELIRSGHACGRQRWSGKGCGRQFTRTTPRGKPAAMKQEAVGLYCTGLSMSAIGKRLGAERPALDQGSCPGPLPQAGAGREHDRGRTR